MRASAMVRCKGACTKPGDQIEVPHGGRRELTLTSCPLARNTQNKYM